MSELKKLLEGVKVEWKSLGEVAELKRGRVMSKNYLSENSGIYPVYSSQTANNGEIGKINSFDFSGTYLTWTTDGANAGTIFYREGKFSITNVCGLIAIKNLNIISYKFLFYWLNIRAKNYVYSGMGNPKLMTHQIEKIPIPIPCPENLEKSLKIQQEIVRILDSLSEETNQLTAALQKELQIHQKQYNFYREELFKFEDKEVEWKSLGEIAEIGTGSRNTNEAVIDGEYPFFVRSQIPRKINEFEFDETAIITAGDGVGVGKVFHFVNGKYALHQRAYRIVVKSNKVNPKFLFYYIKSNFSKYVEKNSVFASVTSLRKPMFDKYPVPVASFEEQERIIKLLHDLDFTTNSIIAEIQKEIELRNKQYEYYRDHLLSFHSLQTEVEAIQ